MLQTAAPKNVHFGFYGPCTVTYSTPAFSVTRDRAAQTRDCVLGIRGLSRGGSITYEELRTNNGGIKINELLERLKITGKLVPNLGGAAAIAAVSALQLSKARTIIDLNGIIGNDDIANRVKTELSRFGLGTDHLIEIEGKTPWQLAITESIETTLGEKRFVSSMIHMPGFNSSPLPVDVISRLYGNFRLPKDARNVVMFSDFEHLQGLGNLMAKIFKTVKAHPQTDSVTMLDVPDNVTKQWITQPALKGLIDVVIANRFGTASMIGMRPEDFYPSEVIEKAKKMGFNSGFFTDGVNGCCAFSNDPRVFQFEEPSIGFRTKVSSELTKIKDPRFLGGVGGYFAGLIALAAAEGMDPGTASMFATTGAAQWVLHQIGKPVGIGGHRKAVDEMLKLTLSDIEKVRQHNIGIRSFASYAVDNNS